MDRHNSTAAVRDGEGAEDVKASNVIDDQQFVWTFKNLVRQLQAIHVDRALIEEHPTIPFCLVFHVGPEDVELVTRHFSDNKPFAYSFTVRTLPWWRCLFDRYQLKEKR